MESLGQIRDPRKSIANPDSSLAKLRLRLHVPSLIGIHVLSSASGSHERRDGYIWRRKVGFGYGIVAQLNAAFIVVVVQPMGGLSA